MTHQNFDQNLDPSPNSIRGPGVDWTKLSQEINLTKKAWDALREDGGFNRGEPDGVLALQKAFESLFRVNNEIFSRVNLGEGTRVSSADELVFGIMTSLGEIFQEFTASQAPKAHLNRKTMDTLFADIGTLLYVAQIRIAKAQTTIESSGQ